MPALEKDDFVEIGEITAWGMADIIGEATDCAAFKIATAVAHFLYDNSKEVKGYDPSAPPNPLFLSHGFTLTHSPASVKYMSHRTAKSVGGSVIGFSSGLASVATQVDVGGIVMNSNATGSTLAHLKYLNSIAKKYPRSKTIQNWVLTCMEVKTIKAGIRSVELIGNSTPVNAIGIATSIMASLAKMGVRLTYATVMNRIAMEIHWRAHVEANLVSNSLRGKPSGPASAIYHELFHRRGMTRFFGQYDVPRLISESGGWIPLRDKLLLM